MSNKREQESGGVSRRTFLAVAGVTASGSLAGCLDRLASTVTTTGASPAGVISGASAGGNRVVYRDQNRVYDTSVFDVEHVPVTIRGGEGVLSSEVDLDGWLTDTTAKANDYNSVRSNKRRTAFVPDDIGLDDDSDDTDDSDVYTRVLELERHLLVQIDAAIDAVGQQDADARRALDGVSSSIEDIRGELDSCSSEVCVAVRANADKRHQGIQRASRAVDGGDWETATGEVETVRGVVVDDITRLEDAIDSSVSADVEALYAYLDGEPTIGERFSVCLPDASLPRGGPAIADEITPRGIVQYLTGEANSCGLDDEGGLYCWGRNESARLSADLSEDENKHRGVTAFATEGGVCVTGVPADSDEGSDMLALASSNRATPKLFKVLTLRDSDLDGWGEELVVGDVTVSPTIVCPVVAKPADAPVPFYAVLYFSRCKHGDEYIYSGGWLIDDAALYEDSCTLLVAEEPSTVFGFSPADTRNESEARDRMRATIRGRRREQGALVYDGEIDEEAISHLPDTLHDGDGFDGVVSLVASSSRGARTGRNPQTGKEIKIPARDGPLASDNEAAMRCLVTALDCPIAHLVDADGLDTAEKAEVSGAFLTFDDVEGESRRS